MRAVAKVAEGDTDMIVALVFAEGDTYVTVCAPPTVRSVAGVPSISMALQFFHSIHQSAGAGASVDRRRKRRWKEPTYRPASGRVSVHVRVFPARQASHAGAEQLTLPGPNS